MSKYEVNPDIRIAETLPASFYHDQGAFERMKEDVFLKSWHFVGDAPSMVPLDKYVHPFTLLDNYLDEPMLLVRDGKTPSFVGLTVMKMISNSLKALTNHVAFGMLLVTYLFSLTLMT